MAHKQETNMLVRSNRLARSKLVGEQAKPDVISIPCTVSDHSDNEGETAEERTHCDKENSRIAADGSGTQPDSEAVR